MRLLGLFLLITGVVGTAHALPAAFRARRPLDLIWALAAPIAVVAAVLGLVAIVDPDFAQK